MANEIYKRNTAIFDMDGTVYDTEQIYMRAWLAAGVPKELYFSFIGTPHAKIVNTLRSNGLDPDTVIALKEAHVKESLSHGIPLKPGVRKTLIWLKENGYRTAIATSSSRATADWYLGDTDMAQYFDVIVSGDQIENGKPAPDIFLKAAEKLDAVPSQCIVLEDSYNGVRAGRNADMLTVMIPDVVPADDEMREKADAILDSMEQLPAYLSFTETDCPETHNAAGSAI